MSTSSFNKTQKGLDVLLDLNNIEYNINKNYWVKFSAIQVQSGIHRPHGIKYSLSLHNQYGKRLGTCMK
jgi:hypothetical protein